MSKVKYLFSIIFVIWLSHKAYDHRDTIVRSFGQNKVLANNTQNHESVKLLGTWASPYALRAKVALNIKLVDYEYVEENLANKSELLLRSNPIHKKIPVLIHNDKPIAESLVIVPYIDEVWSSGPAILPSDPYERAAARFWTDYIERKWIPVFIEHVKEDGEKRAALIEQIKEGLFVLEDVYGKLSKGKPFFGGDQIGLVDLTLGGFLQWIRTSEIKNNVKLIDEQKTPGLVVWANKFSTHPAVREVLPGTDKLLGFIDFLQAKLKAQSKNN